MDARIDQAGFTETGLKVEGPYENNRNAKHRELFKAMIREAYGARDVIIAHHLTYVAEDVHKDGFTYETVEEIPSADSLIFDHEAAKKIWGETNYLRVLRVLASLPTEQRDEQLRNLFEARGK